jgi:putative acetyltransferase
VDIRVVTSGPDLKFVRDLMREYAGRVGIDLEFQGFADELAGLPGEYVAPRGTLLICTDGGVPAGCVGVRAWDADACEMKRLFVRDAFRGRGCGARLVERAIAWAAAAGYRRMLLDTLPGMTSALRLYARFGFRDVAPYRFNPVGGARFLELSLPGAVTGAAAVTGDGQPGPPKD